MGAVPKINIVKFVFCLEYGLTFIDSKINDPSKISCTYQSVTKNIRGKGNGGWLLYFVVAIFRFDLA